MFDGEEYTQPERTSFVFHMLVAAVCLPFYYAMPGSFGLIVAPYVFFLGFCAKPQHLLPAVIHLAYGSQQRWFFCLGCLLYVLVHFGTLIRYRLHWLFGLYSLLLPFFVWYAWQKYNAPRYVGGVGEVVGGWGTYWVFATLFWGFIVGTKINRTFFRGLLVFMVYVLVVMSLTGSAGEVVDESVAAEGSRFFSREGFFAMPLVTATFVYCTFAKREGLAFEWFVSGVGLLVIALDFVHVLRQPITFTNLGSCLLAAAYAFFAARRMRLAFSLVSPLILFALSCCLVYLSTEIFEQYGGLYSSEGRYDDMKITDLDSLWRKLQRKAVDDRASVWRLNIRHIENMLRTEPFWVDTDPVLVDDVYICGKGMVHYEMIMGAHNTPLELLRRYGFYGGLGLYLLYLVYFCNWRNAKLIGEGKNDYCLMLLAVCLSQGVVGGHTGHYPIQMAFGPLLFGCLGACWRQYHLEREGAYLCELPC